MEISGLLPVSKHFYIRSGIKNIVSRLLIVSINRWSVYKKCAGKIDNFELFIDHMSSVQLYIHKYS